MNRNEVESYGKNWNDVNFPAALDANTLSIEYAKRLNISQKAAAGRLLVDGPHCKLLNELTESDLGEPD